MYRSIIYYYFLKISTRITMERITNALKYIIKKIAKSKSINFRQRRRRHQKLCQNYSPNLPSTQIMHDACPNSRKGVHNTYTYRLQLQNPFYRTATLRLISTRRCNVFPKYIFFFSDLSMGANPTSIQTCLWFGLRRWVGIWCVSDYPFGVD